MKKQERDSIDDLFRSKLYDWEAETVPGDWEAIAGRLPEKKIVPFRRTLRYWAAAAVLLLLMTVGSLYLFEPEKVMTPVAKTIEQYTIPTLRMEEPLQSAPLAQLQQSTRQMKSKTINTPSDESVDVEMSDDEVQTLSDVVNTPPPTTRAVVTETTPEVTSEVTTEEKEKPIRRWRFGMGGGSVTAGTSSTLNTYALKNTSFTDPNLLLLNATQFSNSNMSRKTNIKHKTPISVGFSVSYALNNRFSLVSGLNYSFLSSSWETSDIYHNKTDQKLHFIGVPLSLSYTIAEWNRFLFYAAAGVMTEVNVAGKLVTEKYMQSELYEKETERIRMKEWLWSANARAGVSYPLLRFISLYAEVGADYYFDNGSKIETVRSEKPFNVNLQAGFRFGF